MKFIRNTTIHCVPLCTIGVCLCMFLYHLCTLVYLCVSLCTHLRRGTLMCIPDHLIQTSRPIDISGGILRPTLLGQNVLVHTHVFNSPLRLSTISIGISQKSRTNINLFSTNTEETNEKYNIN